MTTFPPKARSDRNTPCILKNNIHHVLFGYQSCTWPFSGQFSWKNPLFSCKSRINLVAVIVSTLFQICYQAKQITWICRLHNLSYVKGSLVILPKHCLSYTAFCAWFAQFKVVPFLFLSQLVPKMVHLLHQFLLSTSVSRMLLTPPCVRRQKYAK